MSDEPGAAGEQGGLVLRLRAVIEAKDEQIAALTAGLEASRERERRLDRDVLLTRHQQGFTGVRPSRPFPSPVIPDGTGTLGLYTGLHTRLSKTQPRMPGRGRASGTGPGKRRRHQRPPSTTHSPRATSCRNAWRRALQSRGLQRVVTA